MENLTHSLIGATIAEAILPSRATARQRTGFIVTGMLAANLPDADLVYTSITPSPLGYLLHHRGHTHTVVGLIGLAALIGLVTLIPKVRRGLTGVERPFWAVVAASLASHLLADSWNSYGVHPFYPIENRWFYGDAVYILEPWLWMLLGASVVLNTRNDRRRLVIAGLLLALPIAAAAIGMIGRFTLLPMGVAALALVMATRNRLPSTRARACLTAAALFVAASFGLREVARSKAMAALPARTHVVDLILNPRPANPLCWSALALTRDGDALTMQSAVVPIASPGCSATRWTPPDLQSISELHDLAIARCDVRAWLQFGRAPRIQNDWIADARYGGTGRGNFSAMPLGERIAPARSGSDCPPHLTPWRLPRADILPDIQ